MHWQQILVVKRRCRSEEAQGSLVRSEIKVMRMLTIEVAV
jgi:hypothetical protein